MKAALYLTRKYYHVHQALNELSLIGEYASFELTTTNEPVTFDLGFPSRRPGADGEPLRVVPLAVTLVDPAGKRHHFSQEDGSITNGGVLVSRPLVGRYLLYLSQPERLVQDNHSVFEGERVRFDLYTANYPDGTTVRYMVCGGTWPGCTAGTVPADAGNTVIAGDHAVWEWSYQQPIGEAAGGSFVARAWIQGATIRSDPVEVKPFPGKTLKGVQQFLKRYAYYTGEPTGVRDDETIRALVSFQDREENSPCMFGVIRAGQRNPCRVITCGVGGMEHYPAGERGKLGAVTRRVLECMGLE